MSPPWLGLPVGDRIVALAYHYVFGPAREAHVCHDAICWAKIFAGKWVHWGPCVYEPNTSYILFLFTEIAFLFSYVF